MNNQKIAQPKPSTHQHRVYWQDGKSTKSFTCCSKTVALHKYNLQKQGFFVKVESL